MNNTFRLNGKLLVLFFYYIIISIIVAGLSLYTYQKIPVLNNHFAFRLGAYLWIVIVTISFICYVLRYLTYNIRLEGNVLKEYGAFLSNPRSIEVSTIKQMLPEEFNHKGLFAHSGRPVQPLAIPYFNILSGETKPFPLYPVNTNLVTTIQQLNPQVNVDSRIQEHIKNFGNSFYANWQYYQSYLIIILASMVTAFLPFVAFVIYTNLGPALIQNF